MKREIYLSKMTGTELTQMENGGYIVKYGSQSGVSENLLDAIGLLRKFICEDIHEHNIDTKEQT